VYGSMLYVNSFMNPTWLSAVAVCCSVLQCVAVCCSMLQYVAVCNIVLYADSFIVLFGSFIVVVRCRVLHCVL